MTKIEFSAMTGKTAAQVRRLCNMGTFSVEGFGVFRAVRHLRHKTAKIDIVKVSDAELPAPEFAVKKADAPDMLSDVKRRKMEVDIALKRQKLKELRDADEAEFMACAMAKLRQAMEPLKEAFRGCRLNEEQAKLINDALTECLRRLKQS